jgi:3-oxoacyl-[acyl-carrier-protein] synthase-3
MIRTGAPRTALVIGAEVFSRILDFNDRTTCVLFGDGAGAVVLEASDSPASWPPNCMPTAPCRHPVRARHGGGRQVLGDPLLKMDGQAVFKLAVGVLDRRGAIGAGQGRAHGADIDWLIPHQANIRIMQSTARKLKLPPDKLVVTVDEHGNTSAASIPLALDTRCAAGGQRGHT